MRLTAARKAAGYRTARQFSDTHGFSQSTYWSHENGTRKFDVDTAFIYADKLNISTAWLITGEGEGPSPDGRADEAGITRDEQFILQIFRSLPEEDKSWILDQFRREALKAGIVIETDE
ncbi:helix-turn-helix domain-containing protein [Azospirillum palustre]